MTRRAARAVQRVLYPIPKHLAKNHVTVGGDALRELRTCLETNLYRGSRDPKLYGDTYEYTLQNKILGRLNWQRRMIVPWLDAAKPLWGSRILEIGCGSGPSTVGLAEQGASVVGIDVDADALDVARERMRIYGLPAEFRLTNGADLDAFQGEHFDFVIFFATFEHMTIPERLKALRDTWQLLPMGGLLVIVETPNRLWYFDGHTARLPFYHWLPDDLAFEYARFSKRVHFREMYYDISTQREAFLRRGRGVSFHEFDVAIRPSQTLDVVSSLSTYHGIRYRPQRNLFDRRYRRLLKRIYPGLHDGFYQAALFLIVRKD
ncbi:MAG TPA: class I SAM-dependent methyltransferase [Gemmatimonadales bacterium]|nr:class I SAM-dependent methyltransferase [Gemmatimonadales bacterium]